MVTKTYCCISLRTWAFIVGILHIVLSSILLTLAAIALVARVPATGLIVSVIKKLNIDLPFTNLEDLSVSVVTTVLIITTVLLVLEIIMASVLIHGIRMERSRLLEAWLVFKTIGMASACVMIIVTGWFILLISCLISFYFIIVIYYLCIEFGIAESGRSGQVSYTPKA